MARAATRSLCVQMSRGTASVTLGDSEVLERFDLSQLLLDHVGGVGRLERRERGAGEAERRRRAVAGRAQHPRLRRARALLPVGDGLHPMHGDAARVCRALQGRASTHRKRVAGHPSASVVGALQASAETALHSTHFF